MSKKTKSDRLTLDEKYPDLAMRREIIEYVQTLKDERELTKILGYVRGRDSKKGGKQNADEQPPTP